MPETDHGIVYPESTDHTRLWEHFQNLAESTGTAIDTATPDTDWKAWSTGVPDGYTIRVRQTGPTVWVSVVGTVSVPTGSNVSIATGLPPGITGGWTGCQVGINYPGLITVGTTGVLYVRNISGAVHTNCAGLYGYPPPPETGA